MDTDRDFESSPARHGSRRKHGNGPQEGPVFVDTSGRRARLLRRVGIALGIACGGYVAVLGLAFVGGVDLTPSNTLPFHGGPASAQRGSGNVPPPSARNAQPSAPSSPSASSSVGSN